jgi:hypothetical protein
VKAIAIVPGAAGSHLTAGPKPSISRPDAVKVWMIRVSVCTTEWEEIIGGLRAGSRWSDGTRRRHGRTSRGPAYALPEARLAKSPLALDGHRQYR